MVNEKSSTKHLILQMLRQSGSVISGQELAAQTGVSRVAVWKAIQSLQAAGYRISSTKTGYQLSQDIADSLYPWEFSEESRFTHFSSTESTMTEARRIAESHPSATGFQVVTADSQTNGRGQADRPWTTTEGSLAFTTVNHVHYPSAAAFRVTMASQIALVNVLSAATGRNFFVRWPNDVWTEDGKVAGILDEVSSQGNICRWVNIGIGINISRRPDIEKSDCVTTEDGPHLRRQILSSFLEEFARQEKLAQEDSSLLSGAWNRLCPDCGRKVRLTKGDREVTFRGINGWGWATFDDGITQTELPPGTASFIK